MTLMDTLGTIADAVQTAIAKIPESQKGDDMGMGADGTCTSEIDKVAENVVLDYIMRNGLSINVLSEEIGYVDFGGDDTLLLDPIDGTSNAIAGVPMFTISMAVGRDNLQGIHTAYLKNLTTNDVYTAEKGKGAFKNGKKILAVEHSDLSDLFMMIYLGRSAHQDAFELAKRVMSSRSYGCASLEMALVAEGKSDGYYMNSKKYSRSIRIVDIAASYLILKEAGGDVLDLNGNAFNMPFDLEHHSNFMAFGDRRVYDFVMNRCGPVEKAKYGLYVNMNVPYAKECAERVLKSMSQEKIILDTAIADALGMEGCPIDKMKVDIIISIGGDGTILRALSKNDAPLFGINAGGVGFLAEIEMSDIEEGLERLRSGKYTIEERTRVIASYNGEYIADAVNEVVVHTDTIAKIRHFKVYVNNNLMTEVRADGIIVSTPTGSTCYAMSLGAPIIDPDVNGMVIVPMAAYKFASRPFVVPIGAKVTVESVMDKGCVIVADGQDEVKMRGRSSVELTASGRKSKFVRFGTDFYQRVRDKLVNAI
jgi:NAD+ kinase